jgi:predicted dehydrogenase
MVDELLTEDGQPIDRKRFLRYTGFTLAAVAAGSALRAQSGVLKVQSPPARVPADIRRPIELEAWKSDADPKSGPLPNPLPEKQRVGYAVVGLGHLSLEEILPALNTCEYSRAVALVSGSPEKMARVAQQYGIAPQSCYSYERFEELKNNKEVDVIYIVLPNGLHKEYVIRGARAGKHILCEKPMANSSGECREMIAACKTAKVKLMVAYRIHYQPHNRKLREMLRKQELGVPKFIDAYNCQSSANPDHWRHKKALAGGGALPDIGLYCLNTARFITGKEPLEVMAYQYSTPGNPLFREVEELVSWQMKFPDGLYAACTTHYNVHDSRRYRVMCERGWVEIDTAFAYQGQQLRTSEADGKLTRMEELKMPENNQFAAEMDHFSRCVLDDKQPFSTGENGLQDHIIMEAIYRSAKEGRPVSIPAFPEPKLLYGPEPQQD